MFYRKKYKYKKQDRVISKVAILAATASSAVSSTGEIERPLQGMKFVIAGKLGKSKNDAIKIITAFGGDLVTRVNNKVAAVISTKGIILIDDESNVHLKGFQVAV